MQYIFDITPITSYNIVEVMMVFRFITAKDERIERISNKLASDQYFVFLILTVIESIIKYSFLTRDFYHFLFELIAVIGSAGYFLFRILVSRIPLLRSSDECVQMMKNRYRKHCFTPCSAVYLLGTFLFLSSHEIVSLLYLLLILIPTGIYDHRYNKNGLNLWESSEEWTEELKRLKIKAVRNGALFFLLFLVAKQFYSKIDFQSIVSTFIIAGICSVFGYFSTLRAKDRSTEIAEEEIQEAERDDE